MKKELIFEGLRTQALKLNQKDMGIELDDNNQVYAAVVDLSIGNNIVSLYCAFDGTVSLYYSTGKADVGLGKTDSIRKTAMSFLYSSGQCLKTMNKVEAYPLPQRGNTNFYLKAREGVYTATIKSGEGKTKEEKFLYMLVQMTINEIRHIQTID